MFQRRRYFLFGIAKNFHELARLACILTCEKCIGCAGLSATGCPPNAVNIILNIIGKVVINYKLDIVHV